MRAMKSVAAILAGFISVAGLSLATDQLLHTLEVYPPWGQPMHDPGLNFLALAYRTVYGVIGGCITAWLAPHARMRHVVILGIIGLLMGMAGAYAALTIADLGPSWYPIALAVTAFPSVWLGGVLYERQHRRPEIGAAATAHL
jgi:hypothetical protein